MKITLKIRDDLVHSISEKDTESLGGLFGNKLNQRKYMAVWYLKQGKVPEFVRIIVQGSMKN